MDYVVINGKSYDVIVESLNETFDITHSENAGRTIAPGAPMVLDPLGTFIGHQITFRRKPGHEKAYDELFEMLYQPRYEGLPVKIVHGQSTISYDAYVSTGERALKRIDTSSGKVYWGEFSVKITPTEAQVLPE